MTNKGILKGVDLFVWILLLIGGLNWGLVGIFNINIISAVFGDLSFLSRIIYGLVGVGALYELFQWRAMPRRWGCTEFSRYAEGALK